MKKEKALFIILLFAILITSCGGGDESVAQTTEAVEIEYEMVTIRQNGAALTSHAPIFIAEAEGYFEEFGIDIIFETFNRSSEAIPLLINGDLDIYAGSVNTGLLNVLGHEPNIKVVANRGQIRPDTGCNYQAILVRKDLIESGEISSPADLVGHEIASSIAGPSGFLLSTVLAEAGLTFDDVSVDRIPTAGYVDAFANQTLSVIVAPELHLSRLLAAGDAVVWRTSEDVLGVVQTSILAFGARLLVDEPEVSARYLAAYLKGIIQYNEGKTARNLEIMAEATSESVELLEVACWIAIPLDGRIDFSSVEAFQQWSIEQEQLDAAITEEQFWDSSVLEAAFELLNQ